MYDARKYIRSVSYGVAYGALSLVMLPQAGAAQEQQSAGEMMLEEITVTARKREENLQDTPISITAFSEGGLEARGISDISQIGEFTPNLVFDNTAAIAATSSAAAIYIRGVGQIDWALPTDPGVGLYVDGVYIARSVGGVMDLLDVERVEVLKGPQGTLFGRNTIGGAISITTKKPHEELEGYAEATVGSDDRTDVRFGINVPLSETFFANFAGSRKTRDGYVKNLLPGGADLGNENAWAGRAAFRWLASDNLEINLAVDGTRERETPAANVLIGVDETKFFPMVTNNVIPLRTDYHGLPVPSAVCADMADPARLSDPTCWNAQWIAGPFETYSQHTTQNELMNTIIGRPMEPEADLDLWGVSLDIDWDINESLTVKSITSYREVEGFWARDVDHSPLLILQTVNEFTQDQFTQEFQLLGNAMEDRLNWIVGLYYFEESGNHIDIVELPGAVFDSGGSIDNTSKAVFGQATYDFTDQLSLTLGARYTDENKSFSPDSTVAQDNGLGIPVGVPVLPIGVTEEQNAEVFDVHANLAYRWTEDFMTYASYSEGYKGGTFTQRVFPPRDYVPTARPEKVKAYELGFKSTWADNRIRLNGAFFYTDYTDMQVNIVAQIPGGTVDDIGIITDNAAAAEIKGAELELIAVPDEHWVIEAGLGYLDAQYTELTPGAIAAGVTVDSMFVNAPELSINVGVGYTINLTDDWSVTPRLDYAFTSKVANDAKNTPELIQGDLHLLNAVIMFTDAEDKWNVNLGIKNLTDETYLYAGDNSTDGVIEGVYARPREWYLSVKRKF